jgi:hypothetical protein
VLDSSCRGLDSGSTGQRQDALLFRESAARVVLNKDDGVKGECSQSDVLINADARNYPLEVNSFQLAELPLVKLTALVSLGCPARGTGV